MSYIRTKDGIYEVIKNDFGVCIKIDCMFILLDDIKDKIIQEADTIAELIDAYVFVSKSGETHYIYGFDYDMGVKTSGSRIENDEAFKKHLLENGTIYGAIWTGKGLIFVSELKDKDMVLI